MSSDPMPRLVGGDYVKRHKLSTRIWHWISAGIMGVMLMSGLLIFNAHPRLYWGIAGANYDPAWLEIGAQEEQGYLRIAGTELTTTGLLGISSGPNNSVAKRAFPSWATLPSYFDLSAARRWHLSFAWLFAVGTLLFGIWSILNGHLRNKLMPRLSELSPKNIWTECKDHVRFRFPCGEDACHYNAIQKIVYLGVTAGLIPIIILSGLTMSPWINAVIPWLLDLFGGRQSARSIHFIAAFLIVLFVVVHLLMVIVSGPINELRSMITGWYRLPKERKK